MIQDSQDRGRMTFRCTFSLYFIRKRTTWRSPGLLLCYHLGYGSGVFETSNDYLRRPYQGHAYGKTRITPMGLGE